MIWGARIVILRVVIKISVRKKVEKWVEWMKDRRKSNAEERKRTHLHPSAVDSTEADSELFFLEKLVLTL